VAFLCTCAAIGSSASYGAPSSGSVAPHSRTVHTGNDGYAAVSSGCWDLSSGFFVIDLINLNVGNYLVSITFNGADSGSTSNYESISYPFEVLPTTSLDQLPTGTYTLSITWKDSAGDSGSYGPAQQTISGCNFTSAPGVGSPLTAPIVGMATTVNASGYWMVASDGSVRSFGNANWFGDMAASTLRAPIVSMAVPQNDSGYWLLGQDGGIFSFSVPFYGSTGNLVLNQPVVGMVPTPDGKGYWFVAADGGVFAYGDARFYGSTGSLHLNQPVVGMAATPDGAGYYLVARDGGIFAFGDARFQGSMGGASLNRPVVGMSLDPETGGYWEVAADGGVFSFNAPFFGSTGSLSLNGSIIGINAMPDGMGYRFVASDGGVFDFGDAQFVGSLGMAGNG
jgi:hypothetical protein